MQLSLYIFSLLFKMHLKIITFHIKTMWVDFEIKKIFLNIARKIFHSDIVLDAHLTVLILSQRNLFYNDFKLMQQRIIE